MYREKKGESFCVSWNASFSFVKGGFPSVTFCVCVIQSNNEPVDDEKNIMYCKEGMGQFAIIEKTNWIEIFRCIDIDLDQLFRTQID